jgi:hypothetical protein
MSALHAVVVNADAYGGHTETSGDDEVYCPACGWHCPVFPGRFWARGGLQ